MTQGVNGRPSPQSFITVGYKPRAPWGQKPKGQATGCEPVIRGFESLLSHFVKRENKSSTKCGYRITANMTVFQTVDGVSTTPTRFSSDEET